jgi:N-acetylmuramoyl-L-alanine amidase
VGLLLILLILAGIGLPAHARQNAEELYDSGKDCRAQLLASVKKQKYRIYWERCIRSFEQLHSWYPQSPLVEPSLFYLGELYTGLYRFSGKSEDKTSANVAYQALLDAYPKGRYASQAQSRLDRLSPPSKNSVAKPSQPAVDGVAHPSLIIENIRHWAYPDYTRLVFDLNQRVNYQQSLEPEPKALKLTLPGTLLGEKAKAQVPSLNEGLLRLVAIRSNDQKTTEVVITLEELSGVPKVAPLSNPERLVIDLFGKPSAPVAPPPPPSRSSGPGTALASPVPLTIQRIVIDPGHGGMDPGAIGKGGLTEKQVVLDIGLRLRRMIEDRLAKTVIMTRADDTFISLDDRTRLANAQKADLFVSIHANAHPSRSTRGVEIYLLGQSSDRQALEVAARENSVSLESAGILDKTLQGILFDLGRDYKVNQSLEFAHATRESFKVTLKKRYQYSVVDLGVKQAPFYVLLNSNMPSILAEISFISNPQEEKLLRQDRYRQAIAESLLEGIRRYIASIEVTS